MAFRDGTSQFGMTIHLPQSQVLQFSRWKPHDIDFLANLQIEMA